MAVRVRDQYKDESYFKTQLDNNKIRNTKFLNWLKEKDATEQSRQATLSTLHKLQLEKALTYYCMGKPLNEVISELNKAWPLLIEQLDYTSTSDLDPEFDMMHLVPADKVNIFPLMVLSHAPKEITDRIFDFTDSVVNYETDKSNKKQLDVSFDPFTYEFAKYLDYTSERVHGELTWSTLYEPLHACYIQPTEERPRILEDYVNDWQKIATKEDIYLKNADKLPTNQNFRGYWCFLAAAVAKVLDIDDSNLEDHPHYPYELRHADPSNFTKPRLLDKIGGLFRRD